MGRVRRYCQQGCRLRARANLAGVSFPSSRTGRDLPDRERAHCPLSGPAGNSGTTDDRSPNAGIILIKPPAQRRMGVKRRPVDQDLWLNAEGDRVASAVLLAA